MPESSEQVVTQVITLTGDLHARPAAPGGGGGQVRRRRVADRGRQTVSAKSVLAVMGLGATSGQQVTAAATGPDAEQAVAAVVAILADATKVGG